MQQDSYTIRSTNYNNALAVPVGWGKPTVLFFEYGLTGAVCRFEHVFERYLFDEIAELPTTHDYEIRTTYRCFGGAGPDECSENTPGFATMIADGLNATGAVYYSAIVSSGYGKCGSVWRVRECAMLIPKKLTTGSRILKLRNPECILEVGVANGIAAVVKPDAVIHHEAITLSATYDCNPSGGFIMTDDTHYWKVPHIQKIIDGAPFRKVRGSWYASVNSFHAKYDEKLGEWIIRPIYPIEEYTRREVEYYKWHQTAYIVTELRRMVTLTINARVDFLPLNEAENCSRTSIVGYEDAYDAKDGTFGLTVSVTDDCVMRCKSQKNIVHVKTGNKAVFLPNKHQSLVYMCEVGGRKYAISAVRNLTKLGSEVIVREETEKVYTIGYNSVMFVCLVLLAFYDFRLLYVAAALMAMQYIPSASALTTAKSVHVFEATHIALTLLGPVSVLKVTTFLMVALMIAKKVNARPVFRTAMFAFAYPVYAYAELHKLFMYSILLGIAIFREDLVESLEGKFREKFEDMSGGESNEDLDILLEVDIWIAKLLSVVTSSIERKSVDDYVVYPVRYIRTILVQSMYSKREPVRKFTRERDPRRRNVRNMRGNIFYEEEYDLLYDALRRMPPNEIMSMYESGITVASRDPFDLWWMRKITGNATRARVNACLQMDCI